MSDLETVNKLYLELSNIATAKTAKELKLEQSNKKLLEALKSLERVVVERNRNGAAWGDLIGSVMTALDKSRLAITNAEREG